MRQQILKTQTWLDKAGGNQVLKFAKHSWLLLLQLHLGNVAAIGPDNRFDSGFNMKDLLIFPIDELIHFPLRLVARGQHPSAAQGICGNAAITFFLL